MDTIAIREETRTLGRELRRAIPDTYRAFGQLHSAALAPGALSTGTKELIALAISVSRGCEGCIVAHAEGAARSGATAEEVAEALGVAILMNGGTATMYGPLAYRAFQDFTTARSRGQNSKPVHRDHDEPVGR
jgi:AhpD family alkylhydroperoxidase